MAVNWGLAGGGNNALAMFQYGAQLGQDLRQRQRERQTDEALAAYAADPESPEGVNALLKADPRLGIQVLREQRQLTAQSQERDVRMRAAQGDPAAMAQLAGIDLDAWRGLNTDQRTQASERMTILGNAALDVMNRPLEQRAAAWDAYIAQLSQQMPELARYQGQYSEQAARAVIAQAEMIGKLHEMEQPHYQVIPEGGTLVDTSNPQAIESYMGSLRPVQSKQVGGKTYYQDQNGDWYEGDAGGDASGGFR